MSMAGAMMTMRCRITRNGADADPYGGAGIPEEPDLVAEEAPCFVYLSSRREIEGGAKSTVVEELKAIFRGDLDLRRGDSISDLNDRRDKVVLDGNLEVDAVTPVHNGRGINHLDVTLRRHAG